MPKIAKEFVIGRILGYASDHLSQKQMQSNLNLKRTTLEYYLKEAQELGYLTKIPHTKPCFYELTGKGKSELSRLQCQTLSGGVTAFQTKPRVHAFQITMKLVKDNPDFWKDGNTWTVKNWVKYHKDIQHIGVSVEKNANSSISMNFSLGEVNLEEVQPKAWMAAYYMVGYLKDRGIEVDPWSAKVTKQEYELNTPLVQPLTDQGISVRTRLGYPQTKIFDNDSPKEASAWIDASRGPGIDFDEREYGKAFLMMPNRIAQIEKTIQGSLMTLNAIANTQMLMAAGWKITQGKIFKAEKRLKTLEQRRLNEFLYSKQ